MCPCRCVKHVFNHLVEKIVDDLWLSFFFSDIIIGENIRISIWELNKVYDMSIQFLGDKENKGVIHNRLNFFTNTNLVHPCALNIFPLYN